MNELEKEFRIPSKFEEVTGKVVSVSEKVIYLDINSVTEAELSIDNYSNEISSFIGIVNVGEEITAKVIEIQKHTDEQKIVLSRLHLVKKEQAQKSEKLAAELFDAKEDVEVKVLKKVNKGFIANHNGVEIFIPESQIDIHFDAEKNYLNETVKVRFIDKKQNNLVASHRVILIEEEAKNKAAELEGLNVGDIVDGTVNKIVDFGAFVKIGHNMALLRVSQVSHEHFDKLSDVIKVGMKVKAKILKIDNQKIDISMKALLKTDFEVYLETHKVSDVVSGVVTQKLPFGIVVELAKNITALIHRTEFSWNPEDNSMSYIKIGDTLEAAIIKIDEKTRKIGLSKKVLIDNPWAKVNTKVGDLVTVKVSEIVSGKGVKVDAFGVEGFIEKKDLVFNEKQTKIEDAYEVGTEITAVVSEFNAKQWVLKFNAKKHADKVEREQFDEYMEKTKDVEDAISLGDRFKDVLN